MHCFKFSPLPLVAALALIATPACQKNQSQEPTTTTGSTEVGGIPQVTDPSDKTKDPQGTATKETGGNFTLPSDGTTSFVPRPPNPACYGVPNCYPIDLLFVVDNSGTMAEEQENLARNFQGLIEQLLQLTDGTGKPVVPSINLMVTTSDVGHPLCASDMPSGYVPAFGKPIATACTSRISDFTGREPGSQPADRACTQTCKDSNFLPAPQPFIHFGEAGKSSNVPMDRIIDAINCIGPQGVNGCGYEAPLEAMRYALNPHAEWNKGDRPFLRKGAYLGVAIVTDEADCSVKSPDGFDFFRTNKLFWEDDPSGSREVSSAVCWNGGVECDKKDDKGNYPACRSKDNGVLYPVSRYVDQLKNYVQNDKEVVMLGILGVPEVKAHNPNPPFEPIEGGVHELQYRDWVAGDFPSNSAAAAATEQWKFGIGPGCKRTGTGTAVPPVRIKEVCESLNRTEKDGKKQIRCCIESICDDDFSNAMRCLSGLISIIPPPI